MKRFVKFLHEVGTVGLMGAIAAHIILAMTAEGMAPGDFAVMRLAIHVLSKWLLIPSLVIVLTSGLLALAIHPPFHNAGWAWIKALLTVLVFEGTLGGIQGPARDAAILSAKIVNGDDGAAQRIQAVLRHERGALWVIMLLSVVNIVLAVWRPRFRSKRKASN